jgi:hypothetical protein
VSDSRIDLSREQTAAVAIATVLISVGVVWLMVSLVGNDSSPTSTTPTTEPSPSETSTTVLETTTTDQTETTTTVGVFDEVAAVEAFIGEFAGAVESGDAAFLFERLHPAVKATYEEDVCRGYIDDLVLVHEDYRQDGPILGPFESGFGEFPITSYEVRLAFESEGVSMATTAVFSLTEGVVRWFAECS